MIFRLIILILCVVLKLRGDDADEFVREANAAEVNLNPHRALEFLQRANLFRPDDALILQRIARQYSDLSIEQPNLEEKRRYIQIALGYAQRARALNPRDPVNVLSLAICHGKLALYSDARSKVFYSRLVREEAEEALNLDSNYAWAHHLLGRWHCEVATLNAPSRLFVQLFYGDLPAASLTEGIRQLRRATELEPTELNHWLELGFAFIAVNEKDNARSQWQRGLAMPSRSISDESAKQRARAALAKLDEH